MSNAVRRADLLDNFVLKGFIACAKYVSATDNGSLQNRIVVRVAYDGRRDFRQFRQDAGRFQKN
jgi:hypothetical protein